MNVLIVGGGLAGLSAAYHLSRASNGKTEITLLEKSNESCSSKAQGGIACALAEGDSPALHERDTLAAGAGLCDEKAVRILVHEGKKRIKELIDLGAPFDREKICCCARAPLECKNNSLSFGLEAAHSRNRILHSHGDQTGKHVTQFVRKLVREEKSVFFEKGFLIDFAVTGNECIGVFVERAGAIDFLPFDACILASGGYASIFSKSSNPSSSTGDGVAAAFRAGAALSDLEFVQFHPTVIAGSGQLVSESVRGEGAKLVNSSGERFAEKIPGKELATRDVLTRAIFSQIRAGNKVFLDATIIPNNFPERFPSISKECLKRGINPSRDLIPVEPAAHYCMGGVKTDLECNTSVRRLLACGEAACTGVHGANRLASNSLLEALVFGSKAAGTALKLSRAKNEKSERVQRAPAQTSLPRANTNLTEAKHVLWNNAGIVRCEKELLEAKNFFASATQKSKESKEGDEENFLIREQFELLNACTIGALLVDACLARCESRGSHFRSDFPLESNEFRKHFNPSCQEVHILNRS